MSRLAFIAISAMYTEALMAFLYWLNSNDFTAFTILSLCVFAFCGQSTLYIVCDALNNQVNMMIRD